jgi:phosphate-selective porin OprO/OprP
MVVRVGRETGCTLIARKFDAELSKTKQEGKVRKKFITAGAALMATAFIGQAASAKSLEDVLKEKGVITEADYKEVTQVKPFDYKLGKGFTFTSQDGKFQTSLGGRMQFRYTFTDKDGNNTQDTSQWDAKRVRIFLKGYAYTKDLTYALEIDPRQLASSTSYKGLVDAWMNYRLIDEAQIKVGQFKVPWARQELISDGALELVDRSIAVDNMKPDYDMGAMLNGKIANGLAYYYLGMFGGGGQTTPQSTNDNMLAARVAVNPLGDMAYSEGDLDNTQKPLLSVGADYFRQTISGSAASGFNTKAPYASNWITSGLKNSPLANTTGKFDVDSYGVDAAFKWMGLSLQAEYMLGQAESQAVSTNNLLRGRSFYTQAGYMIIPGKLEAAVRYSYFDPNRDISNNTQTEQIGGVSYYFNKHNLKLQADVGNLHQQNVASPATDTMTYRVQAQIIF